MILSLFSSWREDKTFMLLPLTLPSLPPSLLPFLLFYLKEERNLPASPSWASSRP